jgi:hypothetical protein
MASVESGIAQVSFLAALAFMQQQRRLYITNPTRELYSIANRNLIKIYQYLEP